MSTLAHSTYKVVRLDADSTTDDLSKALTAAGRDGWKLVNSYHLHHLNSIDFVFVFDSGASSK
jgi:hypothetical protein